MCKVLCVTNRALCGGDFLAQVGRIAAARPAGVILREKDLPEEEYRALALRVLEICRRYDVPCILHTHERVARDLGCALHLPMPLLRRLPEETRRALPGLGASCHSVEEAREAQALGCTYLTAGHVFPTDCKPGVPPRGLDFLARICRSVDIPVWAIGGITRARLPQVRAAGAAGGCMMSALMTCAGPEGFLKAVGQGSSFGAL